VEISVNPNADAAPTKVSGKEAGSKIIFVDLGAEYDDGGAPWMGRNPWQQAGGLASTIGSALASANPSRFRKYFYDLLQLGRDCSRYF
jgi:hypothetical protein